MHFSTSLFKTLLFYFCPVLLLTGCSTNSDTDTPTRVPGSFVKEEMVPPIAVNSLNSNGKLLLAGTTKGAYKKRLTGSSSEWNSAGLNIDSSKVVDFVFLGNKEILAALNYNNPRTNHPKLYTTENWGDSWKGIETNYNMEKLRFFRIQDLKLDPKNGETIYANAGVIVTSPNRGITWNILYGRFYSQFLTISKFHSDVLWTGGTTNIFSPYIAKSEDGGDNWTLLNKKFYFNTDATVYDVVVHPGDANKVLAGVGGAVSPANVIRRSTDGGENWYNVFEGINTRTLTHSARDPQVVYAGGINQTGTLFFATSPDFGDSWDTIEMEDSPTGIKVNDMASVMQDDKEVLYLGTNKGIYSYTFEK